MQIAYNTATELKAEHVFKSVSDAALKAGNLVLADQSFSQAHDLGSLLLLRSSICNRDGLEDLVIQASEASMHNIAFSCQWLLGDVQACLDILAQSGRLAEAALFALTYKPSIAPQLVAKWQQQLSRHESKRSRVSRMIAMPGEDEELFPHWDEWVELERERFGREDMAVI